jgi:AraC-like DNA-binding protein
MPKLSSFRLDLSAFSERDQFEVFRQATAVTHEVLRPAASPQAFPCSAEVWNLGNIVFNCSSFGACRFERPLRRLASDCIDHYTLLYIKKGSCGGDLGRDQIAVSAGSVLLLDLARPISFQVSDTENVFISIPRQLLEAAVPSANLHGRVLGGPSGTILAGFIQLLTENIGNMTEQEAAFTERAITSLLAACLAPSREAKEMARPAVDATLLQKARSYIEENLQDNSLAPATICRAVGVSRSTLFRLFERLGGVAGYIQFRRLVHIRKALLDPHLTQRIADVAYQWGFNNPEHFSRCFRRAFGLSPREIRHGSPNASPSLESTMTDYHSWLRGDGLAR